jgi:hypothetical protein
LGHRFKGFTKITADYLVIKLIGSWTKSQECLTVKAKRKSLKKESNNKSAKGRRKTWF